MLAANPEYKKDLKLVKFSRTYFVDFFARYGWKWGIHKGNKKYFPEQVIQDEVNRIREKMKKFSPNNIWNADETAIYVNDIGRNTFSPKDHVGRLIGTDKQRVTGLLFIDAAGNIPHRPAIIDSCFPTGSKVGVIKESKKEEFKKFRGKQVLEVMKCRDYKERDLNLNHLLVI